MGHAKQNASNLLVGVFLGYSFIMIWKLRESVTSFLGVVRGRPEDLAPSDFSWLCKETAASNLASYQADPGLALGWPQAGLGKLSGGGPPLIS